MPLIPQSEPSAFKPARKTSRSTLQRQLADGSEAKRRAAALGLAEIDGAAPLLLARLADEPSPLVRAALFDALAEQNDADTVPGIIDLLSSDTAEMRNEAVTLLQKMSTAVAGHMAPLLQSPDPDVRIMAVDILRLLPHPDAPLWLRDLLMRETHTNVVGTAIDRLTDIGGPEHLAALREVRTRFADEPYIQFAADTVIARIENIAAGSAG